MMGKVNPTGYSATVRMWLRYANQLIPLSHTASTFVIARDAVDLPAGDAQLVYMVDGIRHEHDVTLPDGMRQNRPQTTVFARDSAAPF
jgi:hypothetical protein